MVEGRALENTLLLLLLLAEPKVLTEARIGIEPNTALVEVRGLVEMCLVTRELFQVYVWPGKLGERGQREKLGWSQEQKLCIPFFFIRNVLQEYSLDGIVPFIRGNAKRSKAVSVT